MLAHGSVDAEERGLLVGGLAVVADTDAGDVDDTIKEEDGGGGFRGEVHATPLVRVLSSTSDLILLVVWWNWITTATPGAPVGRGWSVQCPNHCRPRHVHGILLPYARSKDNPTLEVGMTAHRSPPTKRSS